MCVCPVVSTSRPSSSANGLDGREWHKKEFALKAPTYRHAAWYPYTLGPCVFKSRTLPGRRNEEWWIVTTSVS